MLHPISDGSKLTDMMEEGEKESSVIRDEMEDALCEVYAARRRKTHANKNTKKIQSHEKLNLAYCIYTLRRRLPGADIMTGSTVEVRFPPGVKYFSLFRSIQTGSGIHPASCAMGTWGSFSVAGS
jgi:hypothetical protein